MHVRQHQPSQRLPLDHRNCTITATNFASSPSATRRPSGVQKGRQRPLGTGPIMTPVLTGRSLHFYPQMGIARPQTLALALSLGRLSASSNLCPRHETFDYCNLFLPHPVLSVGITSIHKGSTCARAIASKQTHSTSRVEFQHRLHQLSYPRKQQQQPFQRCICIPLQLDYRS